MNIPKLDPYLENWKRVLGTAAGPLKMVRVLGGVANITNMDVTLRCPAGEGIADGFYKMVGTESRLIPITDFTVVHKNTHSFYNGAPFYPDMEQFNPSFPELTPFCQIPRDIVRGMISLCEHVRKVRGSLSIGDTYITMTQNPQQDLTLSYNFSIPNGDRYIVNPEELKLALIEMMRYDQVFLSRKESEKNEPMILGLDWSRCALIDVRIVGRGDNERF